MRIDPTQPIMFDNDTNPGVGAGWWQMNPSSGDSRDFFEGRQWSNSRASVFQPKTVKILTLATFILVAGFIAVGWMGLLL